MRLGEAKSDAVKNVVLDELQFKVVVVANIFKVGEVTFSHSHKLFSCVLFARRFYEVLYIDRWCSVDVVEFSAQDGSEVFTFAYVEDVIPHRTLCR